jgi:hypothetical protein
MASQDAAAPPKAKNYKGFVAGVFSGIAKLAGEFVGVAPPGCSDS